MDCLEGCGGWRGGGSVMGSGGGGGKDEAGDGSDGRYGGDCVASSGGWVDVMGVCWAGGKEAGDGSVWSYGACGWAFKARVADGLLASSL